MSTKVGRWDLIEQKDFDGACKRQMKNMKRQSLSLP